MEATNTISLNDMVPLRHLFQSNWMRTEIVGQTLEELLRVCPSPLNYTHVVPQMVSAVPFDGLASFLKESGVRLRGVDVHGHAPLPRNFFKTVQPDYFEKLHGIADASSVFRFSQRLRHIKHKREVYLLFDIRRDGFWIYFSEGDEIPIEDLERRFEWLTYLVGRFAMPVVLSRGENSFTLEHQGNGVARWGQEDWAKSGEQPATHRACIQCSFPGLTAAEFIKRVRAILSDKEFTLPVPGGWKFLGVCNAPGGESRFDELRKLKMPSRKYDGLASYDIETYRDYRKMELVAKLHGTMGSCLMVVTFGNGKRCRFEAEIRMLGNPKDLKGAVVMSFDSLEDEAELRRLCPNGLPKMKYKRR